MLPWRRMSFAALSPFLAVVLDIPASPSLLVAGGIVLCLLIAIPAFKGLLDIISWFRGQPPASEKFATKSDLRNVEERIAAASRERNRTLLESVAASEKRMQEIEARIQHQLDQGQTLFTSLQSEQRTIAGIVGELKGALNAMHRKH